ncbi:MAG: ferric reductase-like transmembrane domain-containing protein [Chloroflexi bacterium]|nr:ferric reductase-like transmembrane domain-containing protein [Chloroflexota bacterium]
MHRHIRMIALRWWRDTPPLASGIVAIIAAMLALTGSALIDGIRWRIVQGTWHGGADKGDPWYELGTALGFWGFVLFGLNFVLATRWRWLDRACGGLDRAYQLHGLVGRWAVTALALHLAVLLVQAWPDAAVVRQYLVPGADASFTSGMLGLLLLIMLVAITLWWRLPYQRWLASHRWMGVAYVLGGAHAIIAQGDWYLWLLTGGGAAAWIDAGWLGPRRRARRGVVTAVVRHRGVTDLICTLERPLPATAGQFVWLQVPGGTAVPPHERHPFSLSAIDDPRHVRISARAVGDYTAALAAVPVGAVISLEGGYGSFGTRARAAGNAAVWLAAGIGITPFLALLRAAAPADAPRALIWSVRHPDDAVHLAEVHMQLQRLGAIRFVLHVSAQAGRLDAARIARDADGDWSQGLVLVCCGPPALQTDLARQLRALGARPGQFVGEAFALR